MTFAYSLLRGLIYAKTCFIFICEVCFYSNDQKNSWMKQSKFVHRLMNVSSVFSYLCFLSLLLVKFIFLFLYTIVW